MATSPIIQPGAPLWFGNRTIGSTADTRYLSPGNSSSIAETSPPRLRLAAAGRLRLLRIAHGEGAGNGNTIVYTVYLNNSPTALAVSMASTAQDASELVTTVDVAPGDLVALVAVKALSIGSSPRNVIGSIQYE